MADEFFRTYMGRAFYEGTMPALVHELKRLNNNLEKLIAKTGDEKEKPPPPPENTP